MTGNTLQRRRGGVPSLPPALAFVPVLLPLLALLAAFAPAALAGGIQVAVRVPGKADAPRHEATALLVSVAECHTAKNLAVVGRAEGLVDGERRTVPLTMRPGRDAGQYEVARQWSGVGQWVLVFEVTAWDHTRTMVVDLGAAVGKEPVRVERTSATWKRVGEKEIRAAFQGALPKDSAARAGGAGEFLARALGL
jgi:hypothetical protein